MEKREGPQSPVGRGRWGGALLQAGFEPAIYATTVDDGNHYLLDPPLPPPLPPPTSPPYPPPYLPPYPPPTPPPTSKVGWGATSCDI